MGSLGDASLGEIKDLILISRLQKEEIVRDGERDSGGFRVLDVDASHCVADVRNPPFDNGPRKQGMQLSMTCYCEVALCLVPNLAATQRDATRRIGRTRGAQHDTARHRGEQKPGPGARHGERHLAWPPQNCTRLSSSILRSYLALHAPSLPPERKRAARRTNNEHSALPVPFETTHHGDGDGYGYRNRDPKPPLHPPTAPRIDRSETLKHSACTLRSRHIFLLNSQGSSWPETTTAGPSSPTLSTFLLPPSIVNPTEASQLVNSLPGLAPGTKPLTSLWPGP